MQALLDLVFPPRCAGCDRPGTLLCADCRDAVVRIEPSRACSRCGAPHPDEGTSCGECHDRSFAFSAARCAALLAPPVSAAVVVLKDSGERRYARVLAELLAECTDDGWLAPDDVLVPAPASPAAVRRRGFDHAADITRALASITGARAQLLLRATSGADQRALGRGERFANREGAFVLVPARDRTAAGPLPGRVVLVDDVLTTGATLDAAARVLLAAGVGDVRALAVARSVRT